MFIVMLNLGMGLAAIAIGVGIAFLPPFRKGLDR